MAEASRRLSLRDATKDERDIRDEFDQLRIKYRGLNGSDGQTPSYIPLSALEKFWTTHRITRLLQAHGAPARWSPGAIRQNFLRIFSLLAYEGFVQHFDLFINPQSGPDLPDRLFPLHSLPTAWKGRFGYDDLFDTIHKRQWMFFPVLFTKDGLYNQTFGPDHILPIEREEIIKEGSGITVYKIKTCPSCTNFGVSPNRKDALSELHSERPSPYTKPPQTTFVRKSYRGCASKTLFERECLAFNSLQQDYNPYIVTCYGFFSQRRTDGTTNYNLILEYVDGGDLDQYFKSASPPQTTIDVIGFWKSFLDVFKGLRCFETHNIDSRKKGYQVIHQDIKPENLLIQRSSANSGFVLKIADLGFSHTTVKPVGADRQDTSGIDFHGGQTYGAPECSHHARHTHKGKNYITPEADIFSMGCVMSDAASWVTGGDARRHEYWKNRTAETRTIKSFYCSGHDGCFHNGIHRLEAVTMMHEKIRNTTMPFDTVTARVIGMVENHMLLPQREGRWKPYELHEELSKILQDGESALEVDSNKQSENRPETPAREQRHLSDSSITSNGLSIFEHLSLGSSSPTSPPLLTLSPKSMVAALHHEPNGGTDTANETAPRDVPSHKLTYEKALVYYKAKKNRGNLDPEVHDLILDLKLNLHRRDHLFFVDTSRNMGEHAEEVYEAFGLFSYLAKLIDTNGIEIVFSSAPRTLHSNTKTTPLKEKLKSQMWNQIAFEDKFSEFIDEIVIPRLPSWMSRHVPGLNRKPLSIFVFTDGRWGDDLNKACGVENPVKRLVDKINDGKLSRTQVMIQFVRFGEDEAGIRHLKYLDEFGKESNCDVVDTKPVRGDVYSLFIGAIDPSYDSSDERPDPGRHSSSLTQSPTRILEGLPSPT